MAEMLRSSSTLGGRDVAVSDAGAVVGGFLRLPGLHTRARLVLQLPQSKASPDHSVWVPIANQPDSDWNPTARLEDWLEAAARLRPTATEAVWLHVTRGDTVTRDAPITAAAINNVEHDQPASRTHRGIRRIRCGPGLSPKPRTAGSTRPTSCATPGTRASRSCAAMTEPPGCGSAMPPPA